MRVYLKNGEHAERISLWAWTSSWSSQARVTSNNSSSSLSWLNASPRFLWKSFHCRQNLSPGPISVSSLQFCCFLIISSEERAELSWEQQKYMMSYWSCLSLDARHNCQPMTGLHSGQLLTIVACCSEIIGLP